MTSCLGLARVEPPSNSAPGSSARRSGLLPGYTGGSIRACRCFFAFLTVFSFLFPISACIGSGLKGVAFLKRGAWWSSAAVGSFSISNTDYIALLLQLLLEHFDLGSLLLAQCSLDLWTTRQNHSWRLFLFFFPEFCCFLHNNIEVRAGRLIILEIFQKY